MSNIICDVYLTSFTSLSGVYHTVLILPDVGMDGEVCIQHALKLMDLGC